MKSVLIKIGVVLCLAGGILGTLAGIYHEKLYCKSIGTKFYEDYKVVKLVDETRRDYQFELKITANDNPITKIENFEMYYYCKHYSLLRDEYKLA